MSDPKLSDEQLRKISNAYNDLFETTNKQLIEYKMWLRANIGAKVQDAGYQQQLLDEVDAVRLVSVSPETKVKDAGGHTTISLIYEFPDLLHAWLESQGGEKFNLSLQGGHTIDERATVERSND